MNGRPSRHLHAVVLIGALTLAFVKSTAAQTYRAIDLGTLGGRDSAANSINEAGVIAGERHRTSQSPCPPGEAAEVR